jgi:hypothetical protein
LDAQSFAISNVGTLTGILITESNNGSNGEQRPPSGGLFCLDGQPSSNINFAAIFAHLAKIPLDPLLTVLKGFLRRVTRTANGDEKDQPTKKERHSAHD